ncbi:MAG: hypothetical protein ACODAJ_16275 [Planctomycetota bacterium]
MAPAGLPKAVRGDDGRIVIETDCVQAEVWPKGYVSGVKANTFVDKKTGARDHSFGLDIVDFLLEPGPGQGETHYRYGDKLHGDIPKHYVELPQICTQARHIESEFAVGRDFVSVRQWWRWQEAAPGLKAGSLWEQTLVFPMGRRWLLSSDRVEVVNDYTEVFLRIDMPGHLKHKRGDTFEEVYLSYEGRIPASDFFEDYPPDAKHLYQRGKQPLPQRMIRARKNRGDGMPWLAGMTLDPAIVSEAWCHQRGYVCFIQEIGRLPTRAGDSFAAAHAIGYFDSIEEMRALFDRLCGFTSLAATEDYWLLSEGCILGEGEGRYRIVSQGRWPAPRPWRVLARGRGEAEVNGQRLAIDGETTAEVPWAE